MKSEAYYNEALRMPPHKRFGTFQRGLYEARWSDNLLDDKGDIPFYPRMYDSVTGLNTTVSNQLAAASSQGVSELDTSIRAGLGGTNLTLATAAQSQGTSAGKILTTPLKMKPDTVTKILDQTTATQTETSYGSNVSSFIMEHKLYIGIGLAALVALWYFKK